MHAIPTIPLLDAALLAMPGTAEGAVAGESFAHLLGQFGEAPQPDFAALAAAPLTVGAEAELLPIAAVIAAVRGFATARPAAPETPADLPADAAATDTPAVAPPPDAPALPATVAPSTVAVIATPAPVPPAQISAAPSSAPPIPAAISAAPAETPPKRADMPLPTEHVATPLPPVRGRPMIDRPPVIAIAARISDETPAPAPAPAPALPPLASPMVAPLPESVSPQPTPAPLAIERAPEPLLEPSLSETLDLAHESEWLDRLATDIARSAGKDGALRFRLHPESLGSLQVEMTQGAAGASIRLTAETETARAIIADAQPRLIAEARAQGVRIAETHVDLGQQGHGQQGGGQQSSGEPRGQRAATDAWVRTSGADAGADEGEQPAPDRGARAAAERYA